MSPLRALILFSALTCQALGCASAPVDGARGEQFERMLAREAEPLAEIALESPGGHFTTRVAARESGAFTHVETGDERVLLDIGASIPMACDFFSEEKDLAGSLLGLSELLFEVVERETGAVEQRQIYAVDAGSIQGRPFLALDWLYRARSGVGLLKQRMASVSDRSVYCYHDEVGYADTFERAFSGLVAALRYADPSDPPYYREISVTRVSGHRVGVSRMEMTRDAEGDTRILQVSALLMPRSPEDVFCIDSADVEWSRPDGSLINRVHQKAEGRELVNSLELVSNGDSWHVSGIYKYKPFDEDFTAEGPLTSYLGEYLALRREIAANGGRASVALQKWLPSVDPSKPMEATYEVTGEVPEGGYAARNVMGPLEMDLLLDANGTPRFGSVDLGVATLEVERVYASGRF